MTYEVAISDKRRREIRLERQEYGVKPRVSNNGESIDAGLQSLMAYAEEIKDQPTVKPNKHAGPTEG